MQYNEHTMNKLSTKSDKIRYLHACGLTTGAIAKKLGIRYQHARNVLLQPIKRKIEFAIEPQFTPEQEAQLDNEYGVAQ